MQQIDNLIIKIQQHEHEGFWLILIALIGITMGYSSNWVSGIWESLVLLAFMIGYILLCIRLLHRYIHDMFKKIHENDLYL
jgi:hypothetical protein